MGTKAPMGYKTPNSTPIPRVVEDQPPQRLTTCPFLTRFHLIANLFSFRREQCMEVSRPWKGLFILTFTLLVVASGCATTGRPKSESDAGITHMPPAAPMGWWYARFRMEWPVDTEPQWFMDAMLACEIILPVIEENKGSIALWRVHRRAAPDAAGHQFSFLFYSPPEVARLVFESINANPLGPQLRASGILLSVTCDSTESIAKPNIEDTSDRTWSPLLQRSWPNFIEGVSELWLTLLTQVSDAESSGAKPGTLEEKLDFYRRVDQTVQTLWRQQGGHALLHHLNAIFEYEPLLVGKGKPMRF
jgi:hypothetical protein